MKKHTILTVVFIFATLHLFAQGSWSTCNTPTSLGRVNDLFMVDTQTGYAACSGGKVLKTINGGIDWIAIQTDTVSHRSIEFINSEKGFVGSLRHSAPYVNILMRTSDGGSSWTDLTPLLDTRAYGGICGMAIPDSNTIYGCGNYFQDSAYIVKSIDGGNTWSFIDMHMYATSLIDMYFLNKDTGFATGKGPLPLETAVILYTTDGGLTWTYKFQNTIASEYCWKIQHLTDQIYFASIEDMGSALVARILKSTDGGMTWNMQIVPYLLTGNGIQGVGFIDSLKGWTGGGATPAIETSDGGITWDTTTIGESLNRVFKVNDTLVFAGGEGIWKYSTTSTGIAPISEEVTPDVMLNCYPNPANISLTVDVNFIKSTHALVILLDNTGRRIKVIDNDYKTKGICHYQINTGSLPEGTFFVVVKTHDDQQAVKVIIEH
jgi:photosystem II stability/assembly factor-like uncharacterized protein